MQTRSENRARLEADLTRQIHRRSQNLAPNILRMKKRQKHEILPQIFLKMSSKNGCTGGGSRVGVFYLKATAKLGFAKSVQNVENIDVSRTNRAPNLASNLDI